MRKRILLLTNELNSSNGWATLGYELCKCLDPEFELVVFTEENADNEMITETVSSILPDQKEHLIVGAIKILRRIPIDKVDMIICNVERLLPFAVLLKLRFKCAMILIGAGTYIYYPFVASRKKILAKFLLSFVDKLVVISRYTRDRVKEFYQGDVEVITLGVNVARYFPLKGINKEQAFVFVGELKKRKGVTYLLQAFEKLRRDFPQIKLYVVGAVKNRKKFMSAMESSDNVVFTGHISHQELLRYYSRSIAHVLPSVNTKHAFEGFGLVHLEANACGIPAIGSLDCGNEDVIVDGVTGFLCPQKDVDCIYEKMKLLLTNTGLRERMSRQALEYAQTHTWEVVGEKFVKIIENL